MFGNYNYSKDISPEELKQRLSKREKVFIIDVREPEEWVSGHIPGANHIPLGAIGQSYTRLDPDTEYILVCRSGNRSGMACEYLESLGYKVVNMTGGMLCWDGEVEYGE